MAMIFWGSCDFSQLPGCGAVLLAPFFSPEMLNVVNGLTRRRGIRSKKPFISGFLDLCRCLSLVSRWEPWVFLISAEHFCFGRVSDDLALQANPPVAIVGGLR
jgi:hypothetical protein